MKKRQNVSNGNRFELVEVSKIDVDPEHSRDHPTQLNTKKHGVLQSIELEPVGNRFLLVLGEGRLRDVKREHSKFIPAIIRGKLTPKERAEDYFIENVLRDDFSVLDLGKICTELHELGHSVRSISRLAADKLSIAKISESMAIFAASKNHPRARQAIEEGKVGVSAVERILDIAGPEKGMAIIEDHARGKIDVRAVIEKADQKAREASKEVIATEQSLASVHNEPSQFYKPPKISSHLPGIAPKPEQQNEFLEGVRKLPPGESKYALPERKQPNSLAIGGEEWFRVGPILRAVLKRTQIKLETEISLSGEFQCDSDQCHHKSNQVTLTSNNDARISLENTGFTVSKAQIPQLAQALREAAEKIEALVLEVAPAQ